MLAVVSMALVSCGGGGNAIKPTTPDILYKNDGSKLDGYLKVKDVSARVESEKSLMAIVTLEVTKDIPEIKEELKNINVVHIYKDARYTISLYDKDMAKIGDQSSSGSFNFEQRKAGETITASAKSETDLPASEVIKNVKYGEITISSLSSW